MPSSFTDEEMAVDDGLGYPKAYAHLCRSPNLLSPYIHGPPYTFTPYVLQPQEALRAKDLNQMFPVINPEAAPSVNPRGYVNLLWKQLDHLGNAGFDPALFRVDPYGNVLYLHADSASPLAWEIDHWFPCARGGKAVPSNLRLVQTQVFKKKQNKLDLLVPWWDLQLGISVNQFLSVFASRNSDFRNRAFSFWFSNGGSEELSTLQTVDSHTFPQHFISTRRQLGLAPAAIVSSQKSSESSVLRPLNLNRSLRLNSALCAMSKENEKPIMDDGYNCNPHLSITMARDSLRQSEESKKKQAEMNRLEDELSQLKKSNEADRTAIQELEEMLIKRRRRVEKCRRLSEAQSSYKALLEKMIRDAMHQYVVYKEQLRLNQVATSALMARLEAQRAVCDSSENELRKKFKRRDEIENQIRPSWEKARKRSRIEDTLVLDQGVRPMRKSQKALKKELREYLEEARKASEAEVSLYGKEGEEIEQDRVENTIGKGKGVECRAMVVSDIDEPTCSLLAEGNCSKTPALNVQFWQQEDEDKEPEIRKEPTDSRSNPRIPHDNREEANRSLIYSKDTKSINKHFKALAIAEGPNGQQTHQNVNEEDDETYKTQVGKGNVEKWLQILLQNTEEEEEGGGGGGSPSPPIKHDRQEDHTKEIVQKLNLMNPQKEIRYLRLKPLERRDGSVPCTEEVIGVGSGTESKVGGSRKSFEIKERVNRKEEGNSRCESSRGFRSLPSSPSVILGMRKGVDCMGKKPRVFSDEDDDNGNEDYYVPSSNRFLKSCSKALKKAVNK